ncbi:adenylate kinase isoenzyme 1-like isoform X3 [Hemitrygon akajei]|uniref:adenylate kinase isoenzyme 1-like isoform X3 n=1 Tax=Hemitrygon akajei TaxID=2704970 RepID=UPI003BFA13C0
MNVGSFVSHGSCRGSEWLQRRTCSRPQLNWRLCSHCECQKPTGSSVKIENVNTRECGHGTYPAYGLFVPHPSGGQFVKIREKYGFTHPERIKQIMLEGGLVPVGIMLDVLKEAMLQNLNETKGFIMDGYPQTLEQADIFDKSHS